METLIQDIRYGIRGLLKRPGFTAVALIALTLGIGANTAIFSLVNAVLLRPLPFAEPDRLVWVFGNIRNGGNRASFQLQHENTGDDQVAVLSYTLWQKRFGGDPAIVSKTVMLDGNGFNRQWVQSAIGNVREGKKCKPC